MTQGKYRVAAFAGRATVYDADMKSICNTVGPDAEETARHIANALNTKPVLLEALEAALHDLATSSGLMACDNSSSDPFEINHLSTQQVRNAISLARGD